MLSGRRLEETPGREAPSNRLYRNRGDGTFADVTDDAGLRRTGWASGVCAGDYDNDGRLDLMVTYYGQNVLYKNRGRGFEDVTAKAGLPTGGVRWGSGCTFVDYDRDGKLDLFVSNYLTFDLARAPEPGAGANCVWKGIAVNCGPKGLPTDVNLLYRNNGDGTFADVSAASGIARVTGRYSMTAAAADFDEDGWPDIYVACDSTASILYRNNRDGTFTDVALAQRGRLRRIRKRPGRDGAGGGRPRPRRAARHPEDPLRGRHPRPLPRPRRRPLRGRGHPGRAGGPEPARGVGRGHARPRQRLLAGHAVRHRPRVPRDRAPPPPAPAPGPEGGVPQRRRPALRGRERAQRARRHHPALQPGGRLRRLRRRRGRRRAGHEHERAAVAAAKRGEDLQPVAEGPAGRRAIQPRRSRGHGGGHDRGTAAGPGRAQPVQLLLARRPAPALRPRDGAEGGGGGGTVAERARGRGRGRGRRPGAHRARGRGPRYRSGSAISRRT